MALDPHAFTVRRETVRDGVTLAFVHEGAGGYPLLLLHGYPETKRIWWRNVGPLAAAGYEVVAPDLRGGRRAECVDQTGAISGRIGRGGQNRQARRTDPGA